MTKWHKLKGQDDIDELMEVFNNFRDSVITEMNYTSGAFAHPALLMYPVNAKRRLRIVFQHQEKDVPAIELVFDEIRRLNLVPTGTNMFAQISDVFFQSVKGKVYWAQTMDFDVEKINKDLSYNEFTWVSAKRAQWRVIEGHLGNEPIFEANK